MVQWVNLQEVRRPGTRRDIFDDVWVGVSQPVEFPSRIESVPLKEYVRALPRQQISTYRHTLVSSGHEVGAGGNLL